MSAVAAVLALAVAGVLVLTGCTGGRTGEEIYSPSTITVPSVLPTPTPERTPDATP